MFFAACRNNNLQLIPLYFWHTLKMTRISRKPSAVSFQQQISIALYGSLLVNWKLQTKSLWGRCSAYKCISRCIYLFGCFTCFDHRPRYLLLLICMASLCLPTPEHCHWAMAWRCTAMPEGLTNAGPKDAKNVQTVRFQFFMFEKTSSAELQNTCNYFHK